MGKCLSLVVSSDFWAWVIPHNLPKILDGFNPRAWPNIHSFCRSLDLSLKLVSPEYLALIFGLCCELLNHRLQLFSSLWRVFISLPPAVLRYFERHQLSLVSQQNNTYLTSTAAANMQVKSRKMLRYTYLCLVEKGSNYAISTHAKQ